MMSQQPVERKKLVVDTGIFTRIKQLSSFGYENYYTVEGVIREIRDQAARQNLEFQSDLLQVISPTENDLAFVRRFAKLSGDLGFLSETDIHVIALTYMLQKQTNSAFNIKSEPSFVLHKIKVDNVSALQKNAWGIITNKNEKRNSLLTSKEKDHDIFEFKNGMSSKNTDQGNKKKIDGVQDNKTTNSSLLEKNSDEAEEIRNSADEYCDNSVRWKEGTEEIQSKGNENVFSHSDVSSHVDTSSKSCEMQSVSNNFNGGESDDDEEGWLSHANLHL
jgi:rRNA maturation endonuclease Nob1